MGVTKVTIVDSPEKMRAHAGYSIIIPQIKRKGALFWTNKHQKPKASIKKERITVLLPELGPPPGGPLLQEAFFREHPYKIDKIGEWYGE